MQNCQKKGFTLIELMIVVAIIGSLAAIAIPKFADMAYRAQEASTKGGLGALRSALQIYYADTSGTYPSAINGVLNPSHINTIPLARRPSFHPDSSLVYADVTASVAHMCPTITGIEPGGRAPAGPPDTYGWCYVNAPDVSPNLIGSLTVHCTHADLKGNVWYRY